MCTWIRLILLICVFAAPQVFVQSLSDGLIQAISHNSHHEHDEFSQKHHNEKVYTHKHHQNGEKHQHGHEHSQTTFVEVSGVHQGFGSGLKLSTRVVKQGLPDLAMVSDPHIGTLFRPPISVSFYL